MTFEPDHATPSAATSSWWRRPWDRARSYPPGRAMAASGPGVAPSGRRRLWTWTWRAALVVVVLYYPVVALIVEDIDDDPQFAPRNVTPGESRTVAIAAHLFPHEGYLLP